MNNTDCWFHDLFDDKGVNNTDCWFHDLIDDKGVNNTDCWFHDLVCNDHLGVIHNCLPFSKVCKAHARE